MELIECKTQVNSEKRLHSINTVLGKNEQFLEVQAAILEERKPIEKIKNMELNEVIELK